MSYSADEVSDDPFISAPSVSNSTNDTLDDPFISQHSVPHTSSGSQTESTVAVSTSADSKGTHPRYVTCSVTQALANRHTFLVPRSNRSGSTYSSSSTSESTRTQLMTLCQQLLAANAKLQALSTSSQSCTQLGELHKQLQAANGTIEAAQVEIEHLHSRCTLLDAAKGAAEAHCTLRTLEVADLRRQLDDTKRKSKRQRIQSTAGHFLTLP